jgi:beta-mannosidase
MIRTSLTGSAWTLTGGGHACPAIVPGSVHDALIAAGVIPHPDTPGGEAAQTFVGRCDWSWRRVFEVPESLCEQERVELVFDSLDAVGKVRLNDVRVGAVDSQYVPVRLDVSSVIRPGRNLLEVMLKGPLEEAERRETKHGKRPVNADGAWGPFSQIRKSACNFGWDWGPCCPTCGLSGEVSIEAWTGTRLAAIRPHVTALTSEQCRLELDLDLDGPDVSASAVVRDSEKRVLARVEGTGRLVMEIADPPIWWPRDLGAQPLVDIEVTLAGGHSRTLRTGLRTTKLEFEPEEGRFALHVNDEPVFCRGANWIPARLFPHAQTEQDFGPLLEAACSGAMNMIRVWGGGLYESDRFYERCDELGLLVWQDFMFACATYPEHASFARQVELEADAQIRRLASHPSIVLWCGGNEDLLAWFSWGWRERMEPDQATGSDYWTRLLPERCSALDPTRPYWTESPWSGSIDRHPNDPEKGDRHTWDLKFEAYRDMIPRFASEFGHQAPPNVETIEETFGMTREALSLSTMNERQRGWGGDEAQYLPHLESQLGITSLECLPFATMIWACQLLQARAMGIACRWLRANQPHCEGALVWQLNDVWCGHSWSLIDVSGRPKPAFHAVRSAFETRALLLEPVTDGRPCVVAINGGSEPWDEALSLRRIDARGMVLAERIVKLSVEARRGRVVVPLEDDLLRCGSGMTEFLVASTSSDDLQAVQILSPAGEMSSGLGSHQCSIARLDRNGRIDLRIEADRVLHEACLFSSQRGALGWRTLLPGETWNLSIESSSPSETFYVHSLNELSQVSRQPS